MTAGDEARRQANLETIKKLFAEGPWDVEAWKTLWAEDAVFEIPFAVLGIPKVIRGRDAIASRQEYLGTQVFMNARFAKVDIYPGLDPEMFFTEVAFECTNASTGRPYNQNYLNLLRVVDGEIVLIREYFNPQVALDSFEGSEEASYEPSKRGDST